MNRAVLSCATQRWSDRNKDQQLFRFVQMTSTELLVFRRFRRCTSHSRSHPKVLSLAFGCSRSGSENFWRHLLGYEAEQRETRTSVPSVFTIWWFCHTHKVTFICDCCCFCDNTSDQVAQQSNVYGEHNPIQPTHNPRLCVRERKTKSSATEQIPAFLHKILIASNEVVPYPYNFVGNRDGASCNLFLSFPIWFCQELAGTGLYHDFHQNRIDNCGGKTALCRWTFDPSIDLLLNARFRYH